MFKRIKVAYILFMIFAFSLLLLGCEASGQTPTATSTMKSQYSLMAEQASRLQNSQPAPVVNYSATRAQVSKRIVRWSDPNRISYIYLISYGRVMAFYTVKGSVESKRSYLFPVTTAIDLGGSTTYEIAVVDSPDIDGTYGENADSIFFFTTDDVYVEWSGDYMWVDQPLKLSTAPELVYVSPMQ